MAYIDLAVREGFEPSIRGYRIHAFQACSFNHSDTSPGTCQPITAGKARNPTQSRPTSQSLFQRGPLGRRHGIGAKIAHRKNGILPARA